MSEQAKRDQNFVTSMLFVGSDGGTYNAQGDKDTGRLYVDIAGGSGTVTSIASGTGILLTPDPITTTGSVALVARIAPIATLGSALQQIRVNAGATALEYFTTTSGDVTGPASAVDGQAAVFNGTTGKIIKTFVPTAGSVLFAGTSGILAQDNTKFFWDDANNRLGIGTNVPDSTLTISAQATFQAPVANTTIHLTGLDANPLRMTADTYNNASAGGSAFLGRRSRGTGAAPTAVQSGDTLFTFNALGYGTTQYAAASTGLISIKANQAFTDTAMGTVITFFTTPDNSVTAAEVARFTSNSLTLSDATNIILNTTTGTKIGTATTQKLAFYNSTPIIQPTGDVVTALQNLGLGASLTVASAININTSTESTDTTCFPVFVTASGTQTLPAKTNTTLTYNSNTNDLGVTKINGLTLTASTGTITLTNAKILTVSNTLTFTGTDSSSVAFGTGGTVLYTTSAIPLTVGTTTIASGTTTRILYDNAGVLGEYTLTGTGTVVVMATSPTFTTGATTPQLLATANDSGALGASGTAFADLFLASGGVINWAAANATITHSSGLLTTNVPVTITGVATADGFAPTSTTATGNRLYLPAANTLGFAINGTGEVQLTATALSPVANDGNALGVVGSLAWADLALASGGVIDWNNSTMTITQASAVLTVGGGDLKITSPGNVATSALTTNATQTLTNKRITPRILSAASYTTDTGSSINGDTQDLFIVTAQTGALKFNNPSGTPTDGQKLIITVASSTTSARALTWDTLYGATTVALPTTTAATTVTLSIGFIYSSSKVLWQCVAVA